MNYRKLKAFSRLYSNWARYDHSQDKLYDENDNEISVNASSVSSKESEIETEENASPEVEVVLDGDENTGLSKTPDGKLVIKVDGEVVAIMTDESSDFKDGLDIDGKDVATQEWVSDNAVRHDSNSYVSMSDNNANIYTQSGYVQVGAMNTSHAHIYTDRPTFYFNKGIKILGENVATQEWVNNNSSSGGATVTTATSGTPSGGNAGDLWFLVS